MKGSDDGIIAGAHRQREVGGEATHGWTGSMNMLTNVFTLRVYKDAQKVDRSLARTFIGEAELDIGGLALVHSFQVPAAPTHRVCEHTLTAYARVRIAYLTQGPSPLQVTDNYVFIMVPSLHIDAKRLVPELARKRFDMIDTMVWDGNVRAWRQGSNCPGVLWPHQGGPRRAD